MCTVVCRWDPDDPYPAQLLALRDERRSRAFDRPGAWWPDTPAAIGGRDRQAGGSWCVSDVAAGVSAVVLNRPERRHADPGVASRGVLPLLAVTHGLGWPAELHLDGMAGFNLVLIAPGALHWWAFDGVQLRHHQLSAGTYLFKPTGLVAGGVDPQLLSGRAQLTELDAPTADVWGGWLGAVSEAVPVEDGSGLLVRHPLDDGDTYETVFAQFIAAAPGTLRLDYLLEPAAIGTSARPWTTRIWADSRRQVER